MGTDLNPVPTRYPNFALLEDAFEVAVNVVPVLFGLRALAAKLDAAEARDPIGGDLSAKNWVGEQVGKSFWQGAVAGIAVKFDGCEQVVDAQVVGGSQGLQGLEAGVGASALEVAEVRDADAGDFGDVFEALSAFASEFAQSFV